VLPFAGLDLTLTERGLNCGLVVFRLCCAHCCSGRRTIKLEARVRFWLAGLLLRGVITHSFSSHGDIEAGITNQAPDNIINNIINIGAVRTLTSEPANNNSNKKNHKLELTVDFSFTMSQRKVCGFFNTPAGCRKGASCTHRHERTSSNSRDPSSSTNAGTSNPRLPTPNVPNGVCRFFWNHGNCRFTDCRFSHVRHNDGDGDSGSSTLASTSNPRPLTLNAPNGVCRSFWNHGNCRFTDCRFSHVRHNDRDGDSGSSTPAPTPTPPTAVPRVSTAPHPPTLTPPLRAAGARYQLHNVFLLPNYKFTNPATINRFVNILASCSLTNEWVTTYRYSDRPGMLTTLVLWQTKEDSNELLRLVTEVLCFLHYSQSTLLCSSPNRNTVFFECRRLLRIKRLLRRPPPQQRFRSKAVTSIYSW